MLNTAMVEQALSEFIAAHDQLNPMTAEDPWGEPESLFELVDPLQNSQNSGIRERVPSATCALPSFYPHLGEYAFQAQISTEHAGTDCLYSTQLNKIFVNVDKKIPVKFRLNCYPQGLYIRAVAVYLSSDSQDPVIRCLAHVAADRIEEKDVVLIDHVLRCASPGAKYLKNNSSGRYSVRVPVEAPQPGTDFITVCYKFACLNSCQTGINRRQMGIIYTLEDEMEEVLGRQFMAVRVCSCPKRDKEKEEKSKEEKVLSTKRRKEILKTDKRPKKALKLEPGEVPLVMKPIKIVHIKELAKFASDLIYRDIGIQRRELTEQENSLLSMYKSIIESSEEEILLNHQWKPSL